MGYAKVGKSWRAPPGASLQGIEIKGLLAKETKMHAFRGHGTYVYRVPDIIAHYGSNGQAVQAIRNAGMHHAWVRIHGRSPYDSDEKDLIAAFVAALKAGGLSVAGWGWCQGLDPIGEANLALRELSYFGLEDYVADIEEGVHQSHWEQADIVQFCQIVRNSLSGGFGITAFPLIDWHAPDLMKAALPFVDVFNPQVYWFHYPDEKMVSQFKRPNGKPYGLDSPTEYARLCLDRWDTLMGGTRKELVLTGQVYWSEGNRPFTKSESEEKLSEFIDGWSEFARVVGLNWWHFRGQNTMSPKPLETITKARLDSKDFATLPIPETSAIG